MGFGEPRISVELSNSSWSRPRQDPRIGESGMGETLENAVDRVSDVKILLWVPGGTKVPGYNIVKTQGNYRADEHRTHLPTTTMKRSCGPSLQVLLSFVPSISVRRKWAAGLEQVEYM